MVALTVLSAFLADQLFLVCRGGGAVHLDTARWYGVHLEGESLLKGESKEIIENILHLGSARPSTRCFLPIGGKNSFIGERRCVCPVAAAVYT